MLYCRAVVFALVPCANYTGNRFSERMSAATVVVDGDSTDMVQSLLTWVYFVESH